MKEQERVERTLEQRAASELRYVTVIFYYFLRRISHSVKGNKKTIKEENEEDEEEEEDKKLQKNLDKYLKIKD